MLEFLKKLFRKTTPSYSATHRALQEAIGERDGAAQAQRQTEESFHQLVAGVGDYAIFQLDPQGCVLSWNVGAERLKGYRREEIIGKHFSLFYPEEALR